MLEGTLGFLSWTLPSDESQGLKPRLLSLDTMFSLGRSASFFMKLEFLDDLLLSVLETVWVGSTFSDI